MILKFTLSEVIWWCFHRLATHSASWYSCSFQWFINDELDSSSPVVATENVDSSMLLVPAPPPVTIPPPANEAKQLLDIIDLVMMFTFFSKSLILDVYSIICSLYILFVSTSFLYCSSNASSRSISCLMSMPCLSLSSCMALTQSTDS